MKKNVHVTPRSDGKWQVKVEKSSRAHSVTDTQHKAIEEAKSLAKKTGAEMLIHGKNGQIRERNSYGHDPFPPRG